MTRNTHYKRLEPERVRRASVWDEHWGSRAVRRSYPQCHRIQTIPPTTRSRPGQHRPTRPLVGVVEAATEPLYSIDADGRFERVNGAFVALSGYDRAELVGAEAVSLG